MHRIPGWVKGLLRLAVGVGLITFLIQSGVFEPRLLLNAFENHPALFAFAGACYSVLILAAALRWFLLLRAAGIEVGLRKVFSLHMVGLFFNSLLPGGTGGDFIKGYYLYQENAPGRRGLALTTIFVDRIMGIYGLLTVGLFMAFLNPRLATSPALISNTFLYAGLCGGLTIVAGAFYYPVTQGWIRNLSRGVFEKLPGKHFRNVLYQSLNAYRDKPLALLSALALTWVVHACLISIYFAFGLALGIDLPFRVHGFVAPVLTLINGLPISPGGIGVGEAAGEFLYRLVGVGKGGSEILALVHLCVLGFGFAAAPFYFLYRKEKK